jgi:hypothetical protein
LTELSSLINGKDQDDLRRNKLIFTTQMILEAERGQTQDSLSAPSQWQPQLRFPGSPSAH